MQLILFDDAKQNLETICEQVCQDHEPYVVKGKNDHDVVILSLEDYNA